MPQLQIPFAPQFSYERRRPETTPLYKIVNENWQTFLAQRKLEGQSDLPDFVIKEFEEYLKCGILAHGFLRVRCESCKDEKLVGFSCKKRGFCPSCGAKRMTETSAWLVDRVLPRQPVRQWVVSFPFQIRYLLACHPKLISPVLGIVNRVLSTHLKSKAGVSGKDYQPAIVTLIQRFGSSLNNNTHFHSLVLEGVYDVSDTQSPVFHPAFPPEPGDVEKIVRTIAHRVSRFLEKQGYLIKEHESGHLNEELLTPEDTYEKCRKASTVYRIAFGPRAGKKVLTLGTAPNPGTDGAGHPLCRKYADFSIHAGVAAGKDQRKKLENLVGYVTRPAICMERLYLNGQGNVVLKLKKPFSDGTTHFIFSPLEFIERLVSLVPRPRINLIRFSGILAANAKARPKVVPAADPEPPAKAQGKGASNTRQRMNWAMRLKRVFQIDITTCAHCGGSVKVISCIEQQAVIQKILGHLGLPHTAPTPQGPRGPPNRTESPDFHDAGWLQQPSPELESQLPNDW